MVDDRQFDAETLKLMFAYGHRDPRIAREIEVEVFRNYGSYDWTLEEFRDLIDKATAEIPEGSTGSARVELWGDAVDSTAIVISYRRLQTEAEVRKQVDDAYAHAKQKIDREKYDYERLKRKFGS